MTNLLRMYTTPWYEEQEKLEWISVKNSFEPMVKPVNIFTPIRNNWKKNGRKRDNSENA